MLNVPRSLCSLMLTETTPQGEEHTTRSETVECSVQSTVAGTQGCAVRRPPSLKAEPLRGHIAGALPGDHPNPVADLRVAMTTCSGTFHTESMRRTRVLERQRLALERTAVRHGGRSPGALRPRRPVRSPPSPSPASPAPPAAAMPCPHPQHESHASCPWCSLVSGSVLRRVAVLRRVEEGVAGKRTFCGSPRASSPAAPALPTHVMTNRCQDQENAIRCALLWRVAMCVVPRVAVLWLREVRRQRPSSRCPHTQTHYADTPIR